MLQSQEIESILILGSMENIGPQRCFSEQTAKSFSDYCRSKNLNVSIEEIFEWTRGESHPSRELTELLIEFAAEATVLHVKMVVRMTGKKMLVPMIQSGNEKYESATEKLSFHCSGFSVETTQSIWKKATESFEEPPVHVMKIENFSDKLVNLEWIFETNDDVPN